MSRAGARLVPVRSPWLQLGTWLGCLLLGPWAALRLGVALAPEADLVQVLSVAGFAGIFVGGLLIWMGIGVVTVVAAGIGQLIRGRRPGVEGLGASETVVPRGYRAFPVLGVVLGTGTGFLAGLLSPVNVIGGVLVWGGVGVLYGLLLWTAAHNGYLPFPEPE